MAGGRTTASAPTARSAQLGARCLGVGELQFLDDLVVLRAVHEVVDRDVLRAGRLVPRPGGQVLVGDDQVDVVDQVRDRDVDHRDVGEPGLLDLVPEHRGAHRGRAHAGVAGEHDLVDRLAVRVAASRASSASSGVGLDAGQHAGHRALLALHRLHLRGRRGQIAALVRLLRLARRMIEAMTNDVVAASSTDSDDPDETVRRGLDQHRDDRPRRGRRPQARAENRQRQDADHAAGDGGQQRQRLHQHVREIDLVDAAEELDDRRGRRGALGQPGAEDRVGDQQTDARARVGLQQEQDRLARSRPTG